MAGLILTDSPVPLLSVIATDLKVFATPFKCVLQSSLETFFQKFDACEGKGSWLTLGFVYVTVHGSGEWRRGWQHESDR